MVLLSLSRQAPPVLRTLALQMLSSTSSVTTPVELCLWCTSLAFLLAGLPLRCWLCWLGSGALVSCRVLGPLPTLLSPLLLSCLSEVLYLPRPAAFQCDAPGLLHSAPLVCAWHPAQNLFPHYWLAPFGSFPSCACLPRRDGGCGCCQVLPRAGRSRLWGLGSGFAFSLHSEWSAAQVPYATCAWHL